MDTNPPPLLLSDTDIHFDILTDNDTEVTELLDLAVAIETPPKSELDYSTVKVYDTRRFTKRKWDREFDGTMPVFPDDESTTLPSKNGDAYVRSLYFNRCFRCEDEDTMVGLVKSVTEQVGLAVRIEEVVTVDCDSKNHSNTPRQSNLINTQSESMEVKPRRKRKKQAVNTSRFFSGAQVQTKGRIPKGISVHTWPPLSSEKFGLVQEDLQDNPVQ
jgi:hypothetical protein